MKNRSVFGLGVRDGDVEIDGFTMVRKELGVSSGVMGEDCDVFSMIVVLYCGRRFACVGHAKLRMSGDRPFELVVARLQNRIIGFCVSIYDKILYETTISLATIYPNRKGGVFFPPSVSSDALLVQKNSPAASVASPSPSPPMLGPSSRTFGVPALYTRFTRHFHGSASCAAARAPSLRRKERQEALQALWDTLPGRPKALNDAQWAEYQRLQRLPDPLLQSAIKDGLLNTDITTARSTANKLIRVMYSIPEPVPRASIEEIHEGERAPGYPLSIIIV